MNTTAINFINSNEPVERYTNKFYRDYFFGVISFNGIDLWLIYDRKQKRALKVNITKLAKELKAGLKTGKNADYVQAHKALFESRPDEFTYVSGSGSQQYKGWYASLNWLDRLSFDIAGCNGADWFDGKEEWHDEMFYGHVYLIQPPEFYGTNTFKIGKTGQTDKEMKKRWRDYVQKAKDKGVNGVNILGLVAVKNTSTSEDDTKNYFKDEEGIQFVLGADGKETEYFEVIDVEPDEAMNVVANVFTRMCKSFGEMNKLQSIDEAIQTFEPETNVFHYDCYKNQ